MRLAEETVWKIIQGRARVVLTAPAGSYNEIASIAQDAYELGRKHAAEGRDSDGTLIPPQPFKQA